MHVPDLELKVPTVRLLQNYSSISTKKRQHLSGYSKRLLGETNCEKINYICLRLVTIAPNCTFCLWKYISCMNTWYSYCSTTDSLQSTHQLKIGEHTVTIEHHYKTMHIYSKSNFHINTFHIHAFQQIPNCVCYNVTLKFKMKCYDF